jgi:hypothetical protein
MLGGTLECMLAAPRAAWVDLLSAGDVRVVLHLGGMEAGNDGFCPIRCIKASVFVRALPADLAELPIAQRLMVQHDAPDLPRAFIDGGLPLDEELGIGVKLLTECAALGLSDAVALLLAHGADPDQTGIFKDWDGEIALERALPHAPECVRLLLDKGTRPSAETLASSIQYVVQEFTSRYQGIASDQLRKRPLLTLRLLLNFAGLCGLPDRAQSVGLCDWWGCVAIDPRAFALMLAAGLDPNTAFEFNNYELVGGGFRRMTQQRVSALEWLVSARYCSADEAFSGSTRDASALPLVQLLLASNASRKLADGSDAEDVAGSKCAIALAAQPRPQQQQWAPGEPPNGSHRMFPPQARACARFLLWVGSQLERSGQLPRDLWCTAVMPHAIGSVPPLHFLLDEVPSARPWAPGKPPHGSHHMFSPQARARARFLLWVGSQLEWRGLLPHGLWCSEVMPHALGSVFDSYRRTTVHA